MAVSLMRIKHGQKEWTFSRTRAPGAATTPESSLSAIHPGLINLFANHVRKEAQLAQEKKPSVIKKLHDTKAAELKKPPQKSKEVEL